MRKMWVVVTGLLCFVAQGAHSQSFEQQVQQISQKLSGAALQTRQAIAASQAAVVQGCEGCGAGAVNPADALDETKVGVASKFVSTKPSEFEVGGPKDEAGRWDDEIQHPVKLTLPAQEIGYRELMERLNRDAAACSLAAAVESGLYPADMTIEEFFQRKTRDLVEWTGGRTCSDIKRNTAAVQSGRVKPYSFNIYPPQVLYFKTAFRGCLSGRGYEEFSVYLQRLCDRDVDWAYWARYHADRL